MADAVVADNSQDREIRMRFMRIDFRTCELLREFWKVVEPALPQVLDGFYQHVTVEPSAGALGRQRYFTPQGGTGIALGPPVQWPFRSRVYAGRTL